MTERFDLTGRVALVTGGTRGLGRHMVQAFAEAGADVVVSSRKQDACDETAAQIVDSTGRQAMARACHIAHWDEIDGLVDDVYARFGRVDILVNNAGMSPLYDRVTDVTEDLYDHVFGVNLKGPFRLTALVGTRMVEAGRGSIINVSSSGSIRPNPNIIPYAAAKAGLNIMTEAFAKAFGPNVRVNCIMPGPFFTDVTRDWDLEAFNATAKVNMALGRGGQPEEIVGAALYFASDASSFTTGAILRVDGGLR